MKAPTAQDTLSAAERGFVVYGELTKEELKTVTKTRWAKVTRENLGVPAKVFADDCVIPGAAGALGGLVLTLGAATRMGRAGLLLVPIVAIAAGVGAFFLAKNILTKRRAKEAKLLARLVESGKALPLAKDDETARLVKALRSASELPADLAVECATTGGRLLYAKAQLDWAGGQNSAKDRETLADRSVKFCVSVSEAVEAGRAGAMAPLEITGSGEDATNEILAAYTKAMRADR